MDESMDEFDSKRWKQMLFLQIIEQMKQGGNNLCWFFKNNLTHEIFKSHFKILFHISLI
jgi:hypothetical protein